MPYNEGIKAFIAGAGGVPGNCLVQLSSGTVVVNTATATHIPIGVTLSAAAAGEPVGVKLLNSQGSVEIVAAGAITAGAIVYAAADGEVSAVPTAAGTYRKIGVALEAATADQDIIEVLPYGFDNTTTVSG